MFVLNADLSLTITITVKSHVQGEIGQRSFYGKTICVWHNRSTICSVLFFTCQIILDLEILFVIFSSDQWFLGLTLWCKGQKFQGQGHGKVSVWCLKAKIPLFQFVCHEVHLPCVKSIHVAGDSYCGRFRSVFVSLLVLVMSVSCDYPPPLHLSFVS